jgi:hypothetical protein
MTKANKLLHHYLLKARLQREGEHDVRFESMKKVIQLAVFLPLASLAVGCASPYMIDRGRDAADIFTATVGAGLGAKARVGPVNTGLYAGLGSQGIRGGSILDGMRPVPPPPPVSKLSQIPNSADYDILLWGEEQLDDPLLDPRGKNFNATPVLPFLRISRAPSYYTQCDITIGLIYSTRLGFNPGELLDFILGWTTIDIFTDDLEWKKR